AQRHVADRVLPRRREARDQVVRVARRRVDVAASVLIGGGIPDLERQHARAALWVERAHPDRERPAFERIVRGHQPLRYIVTTHAPPRPTLCWSATRAPSTWRFSAVPFSCQTSSAHCASPVAPSGWPFDRRPPDGFTTHLPPYVTSSSSIRRPPSPSLQRPSDS